MRPHATGSRSRFSNPYVSPDGLLVLSGYGVHLSVERGHLTFADGFGAERREGRLSRATAGLKRLVMLGHSGAVTLEAMRWLHDVGAAFVHIDADGRVITVSTRQGLDDARLRRAQAGATSNGVGITIGRELTRRKLEGQASVLSELPGTEAAVATIRQSIDELAVGRTPGDLRVIEAGAASAYWIALADVEVRFARRDRDRVPVHWTTLGSRTSPLTGSGRSAANPANAILNYLYAMLEAEASIAALTIGLDPGMGLLHADLRARDSLACDLMEVVRPDVDRLWLELLGSRVFAARDFFETRTGVCRLVAPLPKMLAEHSDQIRRLIAPVAEYVAAELMRAVRSHQVRDEVAPTLLTQRRRSQARRVSNPGAERRVRRRANDIRACLECGAVIACPNRDYCDACLPAYEALKRQRFADAGPKALAQLRVRGQDPAHGGDAAMKRGARTAEHLRAAAAWEFEHGVGSDATEFRSRVLTQIRNVPLRELQRRTGLSLRYCSLIRRGERVPHPRHWPNLLTFTPNTK